jgi:hypothetical protein
MTTPDNTSRVSFEHLNILKFDGHIIEAADTIPSNIQSLVDIYEQTIKDQMRDIAKRDEIFRTTLFDRLPVTIHIARLAMIDRPLDALDQSAEEKNHMIYTNFDALNDEYLPYWTRLEETAFEPEVRRIKFPLEYAGIWLGVREEI